MNNSSSTNISIIICTRNRAEQLVCTLNALEECLLPNSVGGPVELLVVDNASTDDTARVVHNWVSRHYSVRYLYEPRIGKGSAFNAAVGAALGNILVFTDDDVRPGPEWLRAHVECYANAEVAAVQGRVALEFAESPPDWMTSTHRSFLAEAEFGDAVVFPFYAALIGANMSVRRSVVIAVGPFNPLLGPGRAGFADDTEFSERLVALGLKQMYQPQASVSHVIQNSRLCRAYFVDVAFRLGVSRSIVLAQNGSPASKFNAVTLIRATSKDLSRRLSAAIRRETYYGTDPHLWYINYLGIAWGNLQGLQRLKRRFTA